MAKIEWDKAGTHKYENGVDHGVLYVANEDGSGYGNGVAWNGLTSVTESPSGADVTALYADNIKYLSLQAAEDFGATIECYTYPEEFEECDGTKELGGDVKGVTITQQPRKKFALCYRTKVGNDNNPDAGYKIHIIYGCLAAPSERAYESVNDSPDAITFSYEISTTPVEVTGFKPTAHLEIDTTKFVESNKAKLQKIEDALYGTSEKEPTVLTPDEIVNLLKAAA